jgi:hypothetical protein
MIQAHLDPNILEKIFNTPITFQNPPAAESMLSGIMSPIMSALGGKKKPGEAGAGENNSMLSGSSGPASPATQQATQPASQPTAQQPSYLNDFMGMMGNFF